MVSFREVGYYRWRGGQLAKKKRYRAGTSFDTLEGAIRRRRKLTIQTKKPQTKPGTPTKSHG